MNSGMAMALIRADVRPVTTNCAQVYILLSFAVTFVDDRFRQRTIAGFEPSNKMSLSFIERCLLITPCASRTGGETFFQPVAQHDQQFDLTESIEFAVECNGYFFTPRHSVLYLLPALLILKPLSHTSSSVLTTKPPRLTETGAVCSVLVCTSSPTARVLR